MAADNYIVAYVKTSRNAAKNAAAAEGAAESSKRDSLIYWIRSLPVMPGGSFLYIRNVFPIAYQIKQFHIRSYIIGFYIPLPPVIQLV